MKRLFLLAVLVAGFAFPAYAYQAPGNLKLSVWDNIAFAVPNNIENVKGFDLGIASNTYSVTGLQWDLLWADASYITGLSWAWGLSQAGHATGAQIALVTSNDQLTGAQIGAVNFSWGKVVGAQIGIYNQAKRIVGAQIGLLNYTKNLHGVQLGLFNISENGYLPAMVFINARF